MQKKKKSKKYVNKLFVELNNYVDKFNSEISQIQESFKPIKSVRRTFYPRDFHLSEEFVGSFKKEYRRLIDEGMAQDKALTRITKALLFHARD